MARWISRHAGWSRPSIQLVVVAWLAGGAAPCLTPAEAAQPPQRIVLKGRVLDGAASAERVQPLLGRILSGGHDIEGDWKVPLASEDVTILLVGSESRSFNITTGEDGSFELDTGLRDMPSDSRFVATVPARGWYSAGFLPSSSGLEVSVYPTTESDESVRALVTLVHDVVTREEQVSVRVRALVRFLNRGGELYLGAKNTRRAPWREVFRLPIPANGRIVRTQGPSAELDWKLAGDGRSLIIDEPIAGVPDFVADFGDKKEWTGWEIEYLVPPTQYFAMTYSFPVEADRVEIYALQKSMEVVSSDLARFGQGETRDPLDGSARRFDVFGPLPRGSLEAGSKILVPLRIDNALVGQFSRKALWWQGGFVAACLLAIVLGLVLGRRQPPPEVALAGLSTEEVLDRIAELDARREEGRISEREYQRYRTTLVEIAAEEIEPSATGEPGAPVTLPREAHSIVERISAIDGDTPLKPERIQERAHLLEALYKSLRRETPE